MNNEKREDNILPYERNKTKKRAKRSLLRWEKVAAEPTDEARRRREEKGERSLLPPRGYGQKVRSFSFASFLPILGVSLREKSTLCSFRSLTYWGRPPLVFSLAHPLGKATSHLFFAMFLSFGRG